MIKRIALIVLGVFLVFVGLGMIDVYLTDPEISSDPSSLGIGIFLGVGVIITGVVLTVFHSIRLHKMNKEKRGIRNQVAKELRSELCPDYYKITEDSSETAALLRSFRNDYADFFSHTGVSENETIQKDATQLYWHILSLQKHRLDSKGISLQFSSDRLGYGTMAPVREKTFFDGKYQITEASETVEAKEEFRKADGKKLHVRKCMEAASYRILSASANGEKGFVCPNCGSVSTRENLIDGCDYCGTKFTIEDLDKRVSEFGFQHDSDVEYAKYKSIRAKLIPLSLLIFGIPTFLITLIVSIQNTVSEDYGILTKIPAVLLAAGVATALILFVLEMGFLFCVFPLIQGFASFRFMSGRMIKKMKEQLKENTAFETEIRRHDKLFSMNGFYSNLINKLSVIHYSRGAADASAFVESATAEGQVASVLSSYQDVIDMQVDAIKISGYHVGDVLQEMQVGVRLSLLENKGDKVKMRKETVRLLLVKDASCKSQAVCAPAFTNCRQCGAPMSLLSGRTCNYCGHARRLAEYDWAIRSYQVVK